jgi:CCR4-NOT transcription complex subunit 7/8
MRIGPSHQAGSDSLLTASTFFKMRDLYFHEQVDYAEFNGKLYGLGDTFSQMNGLPDPGRGGATPAEREDRRADGGGPPSAAAAAASGVQVPAQMPPGAGYGPMATNGAFIRTSMGVGGGGR